MSFLNEITAEVAEVFDDLRLDFMPGARLFLLKHEGHTKRLTSILEITSGGWVSWDKYREQMEFKISSAAGALIDQTAQTSYIGYGVPDEAGDIYVFAISPDARDRIPPVGTNPFWKFYGVRDPKQRFTIPTP